MSNTEINNSGIVVGDTTYVSGNLYYQDTNTKIDIDKVIYDTDNHNYHFLPEANETLDQDKITENITNKIKCIRDVFECKACCKVVNTQKELYEEAESEDKDVIYIYANIGKAGGALRFCKKPISHMFRFITAIYKGKKYELNFMRFFLNDIDGNKEVNCILESIQYDRIMTSKRNSVINKESICYPDTEKAMKLEDLPSDKNVCYNPALSFNKLPEEKEKDSCEKIANDFLDFIKYFDNK